MLLLHRDASDRLQRMLNAIEPDSYIRPHRHRMPPEPEPLVLLSGSAGFVVFDDDGRPDPTNSIHLHPSKGAMGLDCREAVWHTFFALEPGTVLFEIKPGPYDPSAEKEFAPWAPAEGSAEASHYLDSLRTEFQSWLTEAG